MQPSALLRSRPAKQETSPRHLHLAAVIRGWPNVSVKHIVSSKLCQSTIKFVLWKLRKQDIVLGNF